MHRYRRIRMLGQPNWQRCVFITVVFPSVVELIVISNVCNMSLALASLVALMRNFTITTCFCSGCGVSVSFTDVDVRVCFVHVRCVVNRHAGTRFGFICALRAVFDAVAAFLFHEAIHAHAALFVAEHAQRHVPSRHYLLLLHDCGHDFVC